MHAGLGLYLTPRSALGQAWGNYLSGLARWDWWVTLTFRDPPPDPRTPGWTRPGWAWAKKGWREAKGRLPGPALGEPWWVRGFEIQHWRGAPHIHALVGGLASRRYAEFGTWWWEAYGLCKVEEYDPGKGAGFYLCKYVTKALADIEFGGLTQGKTLM